MEALAFDVKSGRLWLLVCSKLLDSIVAVLVRVHLSVLLTRTAKSLLVQVVLRVLRKPWSWTVSHVLSILLLLLHHKVVSFGFVRKESPTRYIHLLLDHIVVTVPPILNSTHYSIVVELLVGILECVQILLLLVQVVLVHFLFKLDVFLVNSVDLLSQLFMLPFESRDLIV